ncbi:hypothetical protein ACJX0J_034635, partial [Zea mays]
MNSNEICDSCWEIVVNVNEIIPIAKHFIKEILITSTYQIHFINVNFTSDAHHQSNNQTRGNQGLNIKLCHVHYKKFTFGDMALGLFITNQVLFFSLNIPIVLKVIKKKMIWFAYIKYLCLIEFTKITLNRDEI